RRRVDAARQIREEDDQQREDRMLLEISRRRAIAGLTFGLALALSPAMLRPAAAQSVDDIKKRGVVNIGMLVDFPPFGITNLEGKPDGFDADIARDLAKDLGVKANIVAVTGPNRIPYL